MSNKNRGTNKAPAIVGIIAALAAMFFGISIPTNLFGGLTDDNSSSVSSVESVNSSSNEESSDTEITVTSKIESEEKEQKFYYFRTQDLYDSHYDKHKNEFGNITKEEYLQKANDLINSDSSDILTKYEDDGDFMYFNKKTDEFLVLSPDGYIRTYFIPDDGIDYWNRQ